MKLAAQSSARVTRARMLGDRAELLLWISDAIDGQLVIAGEPVMALVAFGGRFHVERPGVNRAARAAAAAHGCTNDVSHWNSRLDGRRIRPCRPNGRWEAAGRGRAAPRFVTC